MTGWPLCCPQEQSSGGGPGVSSAAVHWIYPLSLNPCSGSNSEREVLMDTQNTAKSFKCTLGMLAKRGRKCFFSLISDTLLSFWASGSRCLTLSDLYFLQNFKIIDSNQSSSKKLQGCLCKHFPDETPATFTKSMRSRQALTGRDWPPGLPCHFTS